MQSDSASTITIRNLVGIAVSALTLVAVVMLYEDLKAVFAPVFLGAFIAYVFYPLVTALQSRGVPRIISIVMVYAVFVALIVVMSFFIIPVLVSDFSAIDDRVPSYMQEVQQWLHSLQEEFNRIDIPSSVNETIQENVSRIESVIMQLVRGAMEFIMSAVSKVFVVILAPVLAFYILKDIHDIKRMIKNLLPARFRAPMGHILYKTHHILGSWIRGQLLLSLFDVVMIYLGLKIVGMKYALMLGIISAVTNLIPYFGPLIGAIPAVLLALTTSWGMAIRVVIVFIVVQQLECNIVAPQIMGKRIGLHPIIVILALLTGGRLLGVMGMIFALPVAGILKVLVEYLIECTVEHT